MKSGGLKEAIDDIRKSKSKTVLALASLVLIATVSGILLYRFYSEEEICSGAIIPAGKGLLEEIAHIERENRWLDRGEDHEAWPLFWVGHESGVVTGRGEWGGQKSAWIAANRWIDSISECADPSHWQAEGLFPSTDPPRELAEYQYEGLNPPSKEIVSMMNDYFREISDEVEWREHLRYQREVER